tara:strand:- start:417 stop:554 length:138 start_codon:yes stop_codon:yes gene_type:complete
MTNDKTIGLKPFWLGVLAFWQFCQGMGYLAKSNTLRVTNEIKIYG